MKAEQNIEQNRMIWDLAFSVRKFPVSYPKSSPYYKPPKKTKPNKKSKSPTKPEVDSSLT
jgi:hypothetical protein